MPRATRTPQPQAPQGSPRSREYSPTSETKTLPTCHACGQENPGTQWQVAVRTDSSDTDSRNPRGSTYSWAWVGVCTTCAWVKPPGRGRGIPKEIPGEVGR